MTIDTHARMIFYTIVLLTYDENILNAQLNVFFLNLNKFLPKRIESCERGEK